MEFIEDAALNKNNEVSLSALKCLQEILYNNVDKKQQQHYQRQSQKITESSNAITQSDGGGGGVAGDLWTVSLRVYN